MTAKKTLFLRATAFITAVVLMLTGVLDYAFAISIVEGDDTAPLELTLPDRETGAGGDITDFYLTVKDKNGKSVVIGYQNGVWTEEGTGVQMKAEDVDFMSLAFSWKSNRFTTEEVEQLKKNGGLLKLDIGEFVGFDIEGLGTRDNPAISTNDGYNAKYWIENGALYVQLDEGAYNRNNHRGSFTFKGKLDLGAVKGNDNKLEIGDVIDYEFIEPPPPPPGQNSIFAHKQAEGYVEKDGEYYYQTFKVVVGRYSGDITGDITVYEDLGEWFDKIDQIQINGTDYSPAEINKPTDGSPIKIVISKDTPINETEWGDYIITYRARLDKTVVTAAQLAQYDYGEQGNNTVKAKMDDPEGEPVESNEASATINVQFPTVYKTGTLSDDDIIWRITVKTTSISGSNFTLTETLTDLINNSAYIDVDQAIQDFFAASVSQADLKDLADNPENNSKVKVTYTANADGSEEYYIEFRTPVKELPANKTEIKNTVSATFPETGKSYDDDASVYLQAEQELFKELESYVGYDPENNNKNVDIVTWRIDYTVPAGATGDLYLYEQFVPSGFDPNYPDGQWFGLGDYARILEDEIVITDDSGNVIDGFSYVPGTWRDWECNFTLVIKDSGNYAGERIHIRYKIAFDHQDAEYVLGVITNTVATSPDLEDNPSKVREELLYYKTKKSVASDGENPEKADWTISVESSKGYQVGDRIVITDIIPKGLTLDESSITAGVVRNQGGEFEAVSEYQSNMSYSVTYNDDGTTKYKFTIIVPDGLESYRGFYSNAYGMYPAIKYTTTAGLQEAIVNKTFTNHASAKVTPVDGDPIPSTTAEADFSFDPNADKMILDKTLAPCGGNCRTDDTECPNCSCENCEDADCDCDYIYITTQTLPNIPYVITVNKGGKDLVPGDTITLTDTLGSRLTLLYETVKIFRINADGSEVELSVPVYLDYDEVNASQKLIFTLEDETEYRIEYSVKADFPLSEDSFNREEFKNTVQLSGVAVTEEAAWAKAVQRGTYESDPDNDIDLELTKTWEGTSDFDHEIKVELEWYKYSYDNGALLDSGKKVRTLTTSAQSSTLTISDLPATDASKSAYYYVYTLKEVTVDHKVIGVDYTVSYSSSNTSGITVNGDSVTVNCKDLQFTGGKVTIDGIKLENKSNDTDDDPETISLTVVKEWKTGDSKAPDAEVKVELTGSDGSKITAVLSGENDWTYTKSDLPKNGADGKPITYTVKEVDINGKTYENGEKITISGNTYKVSYSKPQTDKDGNVTFTVTNTLETANTPETISLTVVKEWKTGASEAPDAEVKVELTGSDRSKITAVLSGENDWTYTKSDLPKNGADGKPITYTVNEVDINGKAYEDGELITIGENTYKVSYSKPQTDKDGNVTFTVTNTLIETISLTVVKEWKTGDSKAPEAEVKVELTGSDGNKITAVLSGENGWTYTESDLPKNGADGKPITYSVKEVDINGKAYEDGELITIGENTYKVSYSKPQTDKDGNVTFTVTNTLTGKTNVEVQKDWVDTGADAKPSITVNLWSGSGLPADRTDLSITLPIKGSDGKEEWSYTWVGLPKYDKDGYEIEYKVVEVDSNNRTYDGEFKLSDGNTYKVNYDNSKDGLTIITNTRITVPIILKKTDFKGKEIPGATLVLSKVNDDGTLKEICTWVSKSGGSAALYLENGVYTLKETAPDGYKPASEFTFKVEHGEVTGEFGNTDKYEYALEKDKNGVRIISVKNAPITFNINKIDADSGKGLKGATLVLSSGDFSVTWTSEISGREFNIADLAKLYTLEQANGAYVFTLQETAAPNGYKLPGSTFRFTVDENGGIALIEGNSNTAAISGNTFALKNEIDTTTTTTTTTTSVSEQKPEVTTTTTVPAPSTEATTTVPAVTTEATTTVPAVTTEATTTAPAVTTEATTTAPAVTTEAVTTVPPAPAPEQPPVTTTTKDYFDIDNDLPAGDQTLPTDDDRFNLDFDGDPTGDMNLPTGGVIGGGIGLAAGSLIVAAAAQAIGKRRRSKKNK